MRSVVILAVVVAVLLCSSAWADDYNPPSWRGEDNTTFAEWGFADATNPSAPDAGWVNPFGAPTLEVMGDMPYTQWKADDLGHQGVWKFEDYIQIEIPNYDTENPMKEVWVQITYQADSIGQGIPLEITATPGLQSVTLVDQAQVDTFYYNETYSVILEPNPSFETIFVSPRNCTTYVDQIVIDTICVPEPTTICLLGLGALAMLRRRRA